MKLQPRSTSPRRRRRTLALVLGATLGLAAAGSAAAAAPTFPTYTLDTTRSLNSTLRGDIAGSAFVGADGRFHWLNSYATYATTDTGSFTNTFTNTDLGALNAQVGSGTAEVSADTYYARPGSLCYQTDKDPAHPAPSPYEDDHCDIVGVWVDPSTGTWYGVVNDEYDFAPWATNNPTVVQRIQTGVHGNRILTASSTDQGQSWTFGGEIVTSPFTDNDAFDATAAPGSKTWNYGVAGTRLFIDYATGYFYLVYNTQVKTKPGLTTVAAWNTLARAPISGKMAPGTWNKFNDGTWTQPGIAGADGTVENPLGLVASYTPAADRVDFTGKGADGTSVDFRTVWPANSTFAFSDASGASYTANASTGVITDSTGATVTSVAYQDPALNSAVTVATSSAKVVITVTDANGLVTTQTVSNNVLEDTTTHRLYVSPPVNESAITLNVYSSNSYLSVGYDKYVYQSTDLGAANTWNVVGAEPSGASSSYLTSLDYGSLTNQNVSSRSYRTISSLGGGMWDVSATPHAAGQTHFLAGRAPVDNSGTALSTGSTYSLTLGGTALTDGSSAAWKLVPVADAFNSTYSSGFYRLQNVGTGQFLHVPGTSPAAQRALGAPIATGAQQADFSASGDGGQGSPSGSDQWYLQPVGKDTPQTLSASSSASAVAAATNTSLTGVTTYKLVNRNSGLVLENVNGSWRLTGQAFGDAGQPVTISKLS